MTFTDWSRQVWNSLRPRRTREDRLRKPSRRLILESLEARLTPSANDTLLTALTLPFDTREQIFSSDTLTSTNQVDLYAITLQAGDRVTTQVRASKAIDTLDAGLRLFDEAGHQLAFNDNYDGLDPTLVFDASIDGIYFVGVSSAGNFTYDPLTTGSGSGGLSAGSYTLAVFRSPFAESEANGAGTGLNDNTQTADVINGNASVHGTLGAMDQDYYQFTVAETGGANLTVTPSNGQVLLPRLSLYGANGQLLIQSDAADSAHPLATISQHLQPGTYFLAVSAVAEGTLSGDHGYVLDTTFAPSSPAFQPLAMGEFARPVVLGDLDHDGNLDLVASDLANNQVSVQLGRGDGTFVSATSVAVGAGPTGLALGDFDHDGNLDLATSDYISRTVTVRLGRGDGTFAAALGISVTNTPQSLTLGDVNGDGNLDIVTMNRFPNSISVLLGQGNGTFQQLTSFTAGNVPASAVLGDFDGDHILDLAISTTFDVSGNSTPALAMLRGNGDGTFQPATFFTVDRNPASLVVADFNADGTLDIAVAHRNDDGVPGTVSVLLGSGSGAFQTPVSYAVGASPVALVLGDVNGDGRIDLATGNASSSTVALLLGEGDGTFQAAASFAFEKPQSLALGDFDHDGTLDLAVTNASISILLGRGDGSFLSPSTFPTGNTPEQVVLGDVNRDGHLDVLTADYFSNTVSVMLGRGDGTFLPTSFVPVGGNPYSVTLGDINGDGNLDLAVATTANATVSIYLGRGDGTFLFASTLALDSRAFYVALGDFDSDGHLDVAAASTSSNSVSVFRGRGDGTFLAASNDSVGNQPNSLTCGDFNGDGKIDIVTANIGDNTVSVLLNRGDGTFLASSSFAVGGNPRQVAVGDFDNDHKLDIVTANNGDGTVSVLLGLGDGTFHSAISTFVAVVGPVSITLGDLDHDGNLDVVVPLLETDSVMVLKGGGDGTLLPAFTSPVGHFPNSVSLGDFNEDGNLDIATSNEDDDAVTVLVNRGRAQFQSDTADNGIAVRHIPILADLNGDGILDSLILGQAGNILFRRGEAGDLNHFAPPTTINTDLAARDFTVYRTASGLAIAAIDTTGNSVSLYSWSAASTAFQRTATFSTGNVPVRIASADLNGDGLDDLVVANDFDQSVTIAFQRASGFNSLTRPVGVGPSGITFADLDGNGMSILVTGQVSGDVSVLFNDASHSFVRQSRYRAGTGLSDIDSSVGEQTVVSRRQTIGVVADHFTDSTGNDLVVVNRGNKSFTLLTDEGMGRYANAQQANAYRTGERPSQVVSDDFDGDGHPDVAILMEDTNQIWIYHNRGDGTFDAPKMINAGNQARGFSVAQVRGKLALLVGNEYGDILTLVDDGHGGFIPDRSDLARVPLALADLNGDGLPDVVLAEQSSDRVAVAFRRSEGDQFDTSVPVTDTTQPLMAPGVVRVFTLPGDTHAYMVVANGLSNNLILYHDQGGGDFMQTGSVSVGFRPVGITIDDLNGDGIPDLLVANQGSNDISVLIGGKSASLGDFTLTPYQRLKSGGSGPISVAVRNIPGNVQGPDLIVTNSDGTSVVLTGIGSGGKGSGFFRDTNPQAVVLGQNVVQTLFDPTTRQQFVLRGDGGISVFDGSAFRSVFDPSGGAVSTMGLTDNGLVAVFSDGEVGLLEQVDGTLVLSALAGTVQDVSALEVLQSDRGLEVYLTISGSDSPRILTVSDFVTVVTELPTSPAVAQATSLPGAELVLVATLLAGGLDEGIVTSSEADLAVGEASFVLFLPPAKVSVSPGEVGATDQEQTVESSVNADSEGPPLTEEFRQRVEEALQERLSSQQISDSLEDLVDTIRGVLEQFQSKSIPEISNAEDFPVLDFEQAALDQVAAAVVPCTPSARMVEWTDDTSTCEEQMWESIPVWEEFGESPAIPFTPLVAWLCCFPEAEPPRHSATPRPPRRSTNQGLEGHD